MIGKSGQNIKLVQRYSKVKLSAYSKSLQQAVFFGRRSELHDAIKEFISKFDFSLIKKFQSFLYVDIAHEHNVPVLVDYDELRNAKDELAIAKIKISDLEKSNGELSKDKTKAEAALVTQKDEISELKKHMDKWQHLHLAKSKELDEAERKIKSLLQEREERDQDKCRQETNDISNVTTEEKINKEKTNSTSNVIPSSGDNDFAETEDGDSEEEIQAVKIVKNISKERKELIEKNTTLEKENAELVNKLQNSNEKKRKLEQDANMFETEIKRIKREQEKKMEEKNKIILRQKGNLKLLMDNIQSTVKKV